MTPHGSVGTNVAARPAFSRVIRNAKLRRPRYTSLGAGFCNLHSNQHAQKNDNRNPEQYCGGTTYSVRIFIGKDVVPTILFGCR
jgi:hypothetical protein